MYHQIFCSSFLGYNWIETSQYSKRARNDLAGYWSGQTYSLDAAQSIFNVQVHAFEPFRVLHQVLTANCALPALVQRRVRSYQPFFPVKTWWLRCHQRIVELLHIPQCFRRTGGERILHVAVGLPQETRANSVHVACDLAEESLKASDGASYFLNSKVLHDLTMYKKY